MNPARVDGPANHPDFARSIPDMAQDRSPEFRRTSRPDRTDAPDPGRGKTLDRRIEVPARAQLLHAVARPGSHAARDLCRLAVAWHTRRARGRHALRAAGLRRHARTLHPVRALPGRRRGRGIVLRTESGGPRDRRRSRVSHRATRVTQSRAGCRRGTGLRRHLLPRNAFSADRARRGLRRNAGRIPGAAVFLRSQRSRGGRRCGRSVQRVGACARVVPRDSHAARVGTAVGAAARIAVDGPRPGARAHAGRTVLQQGSRRHVRRCLRGASPTSHNRPSRCTSGCCPEKCWTDSAWRKPRPARSLWSRSS